MSNTQNVKESLEGRRRRIGEGKTKIILEHPNNRDRVIVHSKDDITAGDGAKHDLIPNKGSLSTRTTSNVFEFLNEQGIPTSFVAQIGDNEFEALRCKMIPLEVVTRRYAYGSFLKRHPGEYVEKQRFDTPLTELYLKTNDRFWNGEMIPADDPLIKTDGKIFHLYHPGKPMREQEKPFLSIAESQVVPSGVSLEAIDALAKEVFVALEKEWKDFDCSLIDMKIEFGITPDGKLVVSDVIDNDSWRLMVGNEHMDKQVYRDGGELSEVATKYAAVADLTDNFSGTNP